MNYKQTLLQSPQIDAVRNKTLGFGCIIEYQNKPAYYVDTDKLAENWFTAKYLYAGMTQICDTEEYEIIGHPLTHADLLRALPEMYAIGHSGALWACDEDGEMVDIPECIIPLNHRTIEDIPEDDSCWEKLCKVFNLI